MNVFANQNQQKQHNFSPSGDFHLMVLSTAVQNFQKQVNCLMENL